MTRPIDIPADALAVRHDGAVQFVRAFEHRKDLVRRGFALLSEAEFVAFKDERFTDPERAIEKLERDAWLDVAARFELARVMSVKAHREFCDQMSKGELPPITVDNVLAFVGGIRAQIVDFHEQAVKEVFDILRPHEWDRAHALKTNTEVEIGKRVVLSCMISVGWRDQLQVRYGSGYASDPGVQLLAIERVLRALDGRGMVGADNWSAIQMAIDGRSVDGERVPGKPVGETEYFRYRACKNGNLHLEFRRLDLLAKLNACAAGKTLRPAHGVTKSQRRRAPRPVPDGRSAAQRSREELAFFETPAAIIERMLELADLRRDDVVLEPSAGHGALAVAARGWGEPREIVCVEIDHGRAEVLRTIKSAARFAVIEADFLALEPDPRFTVILMNPPFHMGADVHHVAHALRWLRPGGSFVAIASAGLAFKGDKAAAELRADIAERGGRIEAIDGAPFAPATNVRCCFVIVPRSP